MDLENAELFCGVEEEALEILNPCQ